ncbi:MAG: hypothetical protein WAT79_05275 [Saprospiraceae bacterium]
MAEDTVVGGVAVDSKGYAWTYDDKLFRISDADSLQFPMSRFDRKNDIPRLSRFVTEINYAKTKVVLSCKLDEIRGKNNNNICRIHNRNVA